MLWVSCPDTVTVILTPLHTSGSKPVRPRSARCPDTPHPIQVLLCPGGGCEPSTAWKGFSLIRGETEGLLALGSWRPSRGRCCQARSLSVSLGSAVPASSRRAEPDWLSLPPTIPHCPRDSPGPKSRRPGASEDVYPGLGPGQAPSLPRGPPLPPAAGRRPRLQAQLRERSPEPRHAREPAQPAGVQAPPLHALCAPLAGLVPQRPHFPLVPLWPLLSGDGAQCPRAWAAAGGQDTCLLPLPDQGAPGPSGGWGLAPGGCNPALSPLLRRE